MTTTNLHPAKAIRLLETAVTRFQSEASTAGRRVWDRASSRITKAQDARQAEVKIRFKDMQTGWKLARNKRTNKADKNDSAREWEEYYRELFKQTPEVAEQDALGLYLDHASEHAWSRRDEELKAAESVESIKTRIRSRYDPAHAKDHCAVPCFAMSRELAECFPTQADRPLDKEKLWDLAVLFLLVEVPEFPAETVGIPREFPQPQTLSSDAGVEVFNNRRDMKRYVASFGSGAETDKFGPYDELLSRVAFSLAPDSEGCVEATARTDNQDEVGAAPAEEAEPAYSVGLDYTWLVVGDKTYRFAQGLQSGIVRNLFEEWRKSGGVDGCGLTQAEIGERVSSEDRRFRVRSALKGHAALDSIIGSPMSGQYALYLNSPAPRAEGKIP